MAHSLLMPIALHKEPGDEAAYLFIDCTPSGFQTIALMPSASRLGDTLYRTVFVTTKHQTLADAKTKWAERKAQFELSGYRADLSQADALPADGAYASAFIISEFQADTLEEQRLRATELGNVVDPRKTRAADLKAKAKEVERVAKVDGFPHALDDPSADWSEAGALTIQIVKTGATVEVRASAPAASSHAHSIRQRVAHEIGGSFDLSGFIDDAGVFVVETTVLDASLAQRLGRARSTVVRRPRRFTTREERLGALHAVVAPAGTQQLRVKAKHPQATFYVNRLIDRDLALTIVPHLPEFYRESKDDHDAATAVSSHE